MMKRGTEVARKFERSEAEVRRRGAEARERVYLARFIEGV